MSCALTGLKAATQCIPLEERPSSISESSTFQPAEQPAASQLEASAAPIDKPPAPAEPPRSTAAVAPAAACASTSVPVARASSLKKTVSESQIAVAGEAGASRADKSVKIVDQPAPASSAESPSEGAGGGSPGQQQQAELTVDVVNQRLEAMGGYLLRLERKMNSDMSLILELVRAYAAASVEKREREIEAAITRRMTHQKSTTSSTSSTVSELRHKMEHSSPARKLQKHGSSGVHSAAYAAGQRHSQSQLKSLDSFGGYSGDEQQPEHKSPHLSHLKSAGSSTADVSHPVRERSGSTATPTVRALSSMAISTPSVAQVGAAEPHAQPDELPPAPASARVPHFIKKSMRPPHVSRTNAAAVLSSRSQSQDES